MPELEQEEGRRVCEQVPILDIVYECSQAAQVGS